MDTSSDIILLMTATVDPRGCPDAKFSIPERIEQYKKAFRFYLGKLETAENDRKGFNKIVFCENSGFDLGVFVELVPDEKKNLVEFLSFNPDEFIPSRGKSRNEELMLDKAIDTSCFLKKGDPFFLKVTGRFSILNIAAFTKEIRKKLPELDFYCDCKDHKLFSSIGLKWRQTWCDTRRIGFRVAFYRKFVYGRYEELDDLSFKIIELQMFSLSRSQRLNPRTSHRACQDLFVDGLNAQKIHLLNIPIPSKLQKPYFYLRALQSNIMRFLFPNFWF